MPEFLYNKKLYYNPVEFAMDRIGGTWKMPILWRLNERIWRYNELQRSLGKVTPKMLTQQLRELERDGLLERTVYPVVPPKVEYSITHEGRSVIPIIETLRTWGYEYRDRHSTAGE